MEKLRLLGYIFLIIWVLGLFANEIFPALNYHWGYLISGLIMVMILKIIESKYKDKK